MKKHLSVLLLFLATFFLAQINIPNKSQKGMILTKTNEKIYYSNLTYSDGKLKFLNIENQKEEFLYDASVSEIKENEILTNQINPVSSSSPASMVKPKLTSNDDIKNYLLKNNDPLYVKGKKLSNLGTGFLIGGAACFVVGGLLNLSQSNNNEVVTSNNNKKGSPVPLIIGLVGAGAGLIMKLSGHSQMNQAVNNHKTSSILNKDYLRENLVLVANNRGLGLQLKF